MMAGGLRVPVLSSGGGWVEHKGAKCGGRQQAPIACLHSNALASYTCTLAQQVSALKGSP